MDAIVRVTTAVSTTSIAIVKVVTTTISATATAIPAPPFVQVTAIHASLIVAVAATAPAAAPHQKPDTVHRRVPALSVLLFLNGGRLAIPNVTITPIIAVSASVTNLAATSTSIITSAPPSATDVIVTPAVIGIIASAPTVTTL